MAFLLDTLLKNAVLLLPDGTVCKDAEVGIRGGEIVSIADKGKSGETADTVDCGGNLLTPGFYNAHAHSPMTILRGYGENLPLMRWLTERIFPAEDKLTADDVYYGTLLACMEMARGGTVSASDMYFFTMAMGEAFSDAGMKVNLSPALTCSDDSRFDELPICKTMGELSERFAGHPLVHVELSIHAEYTTSMERMRFVADLVRKYKEPMFVHSSETRSEVAGCVERYGVTPTVLFDKLGMYDYGGGAFHCVHMSDEDIAIFKKRGLTAVLNPASNLKLASGIAPVKRFIDEGIALAIGTDGAGSNNALDMFREMYLVSVLAKYRENDASAVDAAKVLEAACVGGARAMGLNDCDGIAVGKKADLAVIDLNRPNMRPINNIAKNIVYAGSKENVRLTMVNGRVLYENGEFFIGEDARKIYDEAEKIMETIKQ